MGNIESDMRAWRRQGLRMCIFTSDKDIPGHVRLTTRTLQYLIIPLLSAALLVVGNQTFTNVGLILAQRSCLKLLLLYPSINIGNLDMIVNYLYAEKVKFCFKEKQANVMRFTQRSNFWDRPLSDEFVKFLLIYLQFVKFLWLYLQGSSTFRIARPSPSFPSGILWPGQQVAKDRGEKIGFSFSLNSECRNVINLDILTPGKDTNDSVYEQTFEYKTLQGSTNTLVKDLSYDTPPLCKVHLFVIHHLIFFCNFWTNMTFCCCSGFHIISVEAYKH